MKGEAHKVTYCDCAEWPEQIQKVNAPIVLQSVRSGHRWQYDGIPFRYCPWCGKKLKHKLEKPNG